MWGHGLPDKGNFLGLLFNESSQSLVAAFQQEQSNGKWSEDLYYRHKSVTEYLKIPSPCEAIHYSYVISAAGAPKIFFNVTRWDERGGDWESLSSFNLETAELCAEVGQHSLREPESKRAWVSSLISVNHDATNIVCTIGFEQDIGAGNSTVHYWLCDLRLADFTVTKISLLQNTFL